MSNLIGIQPRGLNASCPAVKSDGNFILVHNHRNLAYTVGVFQHVF